MRDHRVRQHALRSRRASGEVVGLARRHRVPKPLRQQVRPVPTVHRPCQRARNIGEVPGALCAGWNRNESGLNPLRGPSRFVIGKEEHLLPLERSPNSPARLILIECGSLRRKVVPRVERGVAKELEHVAVQHIAARLGDDVDDAAIVVTVLGIEVVRQDAELIDRVEVRHDRCAAVHVLLDVATIHEKAVRGFALATDRHITRVELSGRRDRAGHARHDHRIGLDRRRRYDAGLNR